MNSKKALIIGVSGQDGTYLAKLLLEKGYVVIGTSRDATSSSFANLKRLNISEDVQVESVSLNDFRSVIQVLKKHSPDEIYNLAGQSSVGLSFEQPVETFESISVAVLNLLEAVRFMELPVRLYNASTSECFGSTNGMPATETTPFHPRSPYAVAKAAAFWQVANYREAYGMYACSGYKKRCEKAKIPKDQAVFKTKHQQALEMVFQVRKNGVRSKWVGFMASPATTLLLSATSPTTGKNSSVISTKTIRSITMIPDRWYRRQHPREENDQASFRLNACYAGRRMGSKTGSRSLEAC